MNKKIILIGIVIVFLLLAVFFVPKESSPKTVQKATVISENDPPQIVSTNPDPLEDNIVSSTQTIEITFNRPLENVGELKLRIEPQIDLKKELSSDRKTAKITPTKPLELGVTYTLFIGPDTKFDGVGAWNREQMYHFKTVTYRGV